MPLQIIIPMAGRGSRFSDAGYSEPKPLIKVGKRRMIDWVIQNVRPPCPHRFIFVCQRSHLEEYPEIENVLLQAGNNTSIVKLNGITQGAACTVLAARDYLDSHQPLMIANSDQFIEFSMASYLAKMDEAEADGIILCFKSNDPKWSYCKLDDHGNVLEVVEKKVVSDNATVGIYNFKKANEFIQGAEKMISMDLRVNGEFYVAPVYNQIIAEGKKVVTFSMNGPNAIMHGLGTPNDLETFLKSECFLRHNL
jgi:dTDP-glucose pyrophosphorylase